MTQRLRVALIGCSKTKISLGKNRGGAVTPKEMYGGALFVKRVEYCESRGVPWMVLSAKYGLWDPKIAMKPYDATMSEMSSADRAIWHAHTAYHVLYELWEPFENGEADGPFPPNSLIVEIHAGKDYAHPLADILQCVGVNVELPCEGLGIGEQLALYTSGALR